VYDLLAQPGREGEIRALVAASVVIALASVALAQALDASHRRRLET
jgi:hypothetical protein